MDREALYEELMAECNKGEDADTVKLAFITGMIHSLRIYEDYDVPEIELPFYMIFRKIGEKRKREMEGLLCAIITQPMQRKLLNSSTV